MAIARYNANGTPDKSFGTNGKLTSQIGSGDSESFSVLIQSDGKIVAGGYAYNDNSDIDFALVRYNNDGTPIFHSIQPDM